MNLNITCFFFGHRFHPDEMQILYQKVFNQQQSPQPPQYRRIRCINCNQLFQGEIGLVLVQVLVKPTITKAIPPIVDQVPPSEPPAPSG